MLWEEEANVVVVGDDAVVVDDDDVVVVVNGCTNGFGCWGRRRPVMLLLEILL